MIAGRKHQDRLRAEYRAREIKDMCGRLSSSLAKLGKLFVPVSVESREARDARWAHYDKAKRVIHRAQRHYEMLRRRGFLGVCQPF
jgi:hypothetical protein